jgi:hypothetical protein
MRKRETIDITIEKTYRRHSGWSFGLVMIALGCLFLLRNYGYPMPDNWWAFILLVPALPNLSRAVYFARRGDLREALMPLARACLYSFLAAAFLLDWDWAQIWPIFLIAGGVGMIVLSRDKAF